MRRTGCYRPTSPFSTEFYLLRPRRPQTRLISEPAGLAHALPDALRYLLLNPGNDLHRLVELKRQHRLRRNFNCATLGRDLADHASSRSSSCSDCRAFPTTCDRSDDGSECRTAAGEFRGSLVGAHPLSPLLL